MSEGKLRLLKYLTVAFFGGFVGIGLRLIVSGWAN